MRHCLTGMDSDVSIPNHNNTFWGAGPYEAPYAPEF